MNLTPFEDKHNATPISNRVLINRYNGKIAKHSSMDNSKGFDTHVVVNGEASIHFHNHHPAQLRRQLKTGNL